MYQSILNEDLIQKEKVEIDCEKGAQISIVAKKIVTQGWSEIMIVKYKQATHYICFLFSWCYVCVTDLIKKLELHLVVTFTFNKD